MRKVAESKKNPKQLNLYLSEEVQEAARELAKNKSISLSQLVTELVEKCFQDFVSNTEPADEQILRSVAYGLLERLGANLERSVDSETEVIKFHGKEFGVVFRTYPYLSSESTKVLQRLAYVSSKLDLYGYLIVLPDATSDAVLNKFKSLANESAYVPISVTKVRDLENTLVKLSEEKVFEAEKQLAVLEMHKLPPRPSSQESKRVQARVSAKTTKR
jgi:hypothetical protein